MAPGCVVGRLEYGPVREFALRLAGSHLDHEAHRPRSTGHDLAQRDGIVASWSLIAVVRVSAAIEVGMAELVTCTTWSPRTSAP
jgi:hypothetical protein